MKPVTLLLITALAAASMAQPMHAQQVSIREQLIARGAPAEFADQVAAVVAAAEAEALPTEPLVSKALEGWAKRGRVPPERVLAVLSQTQASLRLGREVTLGAGFDPPPGAVVAAAAGALGRGISREQVLDIMTAAPEPAGAATGLTVAAALAAQGLDRPAAVKAVRDAFRAGRSPDEVLEFPSAVTGLRAHGESLADVARRILEGGGLPMPSQQGMGPQAGRPPGVPGSQPGQGSAKKKGQSNKP
ncbi:MAG: hypothetical protein AMS18_15865 [Gemmatimonas sp. SG8_17]|nr:MAG: hypothetical protein AMS18_15865 [Gemmatimonas sp. SG8_17]